MHVAGANLNAVICLACLSFGASKEVVTRCVLLCLKPRAWRVWAVFEARLVEEELAFLKQIGRQNICCVCL